MTQKTQKLVSKSELKTVYGVPYSFGYISQLERDGKFPMRVRVSASEFGWVPEEVEVWVAERRAARER